MFELSGQVVCTYCILAPVCLSVVRFICSYSCRCRFLSHTLRATFYTFWILQCLTIWLDWLHSTRIFCYSLISLFAAIVFILFNFCLHPVLPFDTLPCLISFFLFTRMKSCRHQYQIIFSIVFKQQKVLYVYVKIYIYEYILLLFWTKKKERNVCCLFFFIRMFFFRKVP